MRIQPTGFPGFDPNRFSLVLRTQESPLGPAIQAVDPVADLARQLIGLQDLLGGLRKAAGPRRTSSGTTRIGRGLATAFSKSRLEVTTAGSPTTLSTQGLVGSPTSLIGLTKSFTGTSTSQAVFNGTYDGSLGAQAGLTFLSKDDGVLGEDDIDIEVFDDFGIRIDRFKIEKEDPGRVFSLSVGLDVRFTAGTMQKNDTFTLDVSTSNGVVDPDQPFQGSGLPGSGSHQAAFQLGSTSVPTLGGQYAGAFDDNLSFEVTRGGILGTNDVTVEAFDGLGESLGKLEFKKELAPGTALSLSNGVTLALSPGVALKNDRFEVAVRADDQVNFTGGAQVQAGSLFINGTEIEVDALDTIRTLADKITSSDAGVEATFDAVSGEFRLTRLEDGPTVIDLGADNTGFFAAVGLVEGQQVPGTVAGTTGVTRLSELKGLTSGTFSINGETLSVDVINDTIDDVLARINSLELGIQASYENNRLLLRSSESFDLQNGTSAFFDAFQVDIGLYKASKIVGRGHAEGVQDRSELKRTLRGLQRSLNDVLALPSAPQLPDVSAALLQAVRDSFNRDERDSYSLNTGLGLRFRVEDPASVMVVDSGVLDRALSGRSHELRDFLSGRPGNRGDPGFVERLSAAVDDLIDHVASKLDPGRDSGLLLDLRG